MSTFKVTVETLESVTPHPNADRLELGKVAGLAYQFAIAKDTFKPGDVVVYFPIDSLLPVKLSDHLGVTDKLNKGRVKTVKLRGSISQGIVVKANHLDIHEPVGTDVAERLGVTKYEAPEPLTKDAVIKPLPGLVSVYDLENAERYQRIVDSLMDTQVIVTEKVEGSHFAISIDKAGEIRVYQRRFEIIRREGDSHTWWSTAEKIGLIEKMKALYAEISSDRPDTEFVLLRGEIVGMGIQGNYYGGNGHTIYAFEIEIDGKPVNAARFLYCCARGNIQTAPLVFEGRLAKCLEGKSVQEVSNGKSLINPAKMREGIVIRPMLEQTDLELGRVIIKQRSPMYLAGTEY